MVNQKARKQGWARGGGIGGAAAGSGGGGSHLPCSRRPCPAGSWRPSMMIRLSGGVDLKYAA